MFFCNSCNSIFFLMNCPFKEGRLSSCGKQRDNTGSITTMCHALSCVVDPVRGPCETSWAQAVETRIALLKHTHAQTRHTLPHGGSRLYSLQEGTHVLVCVSVSRVRQRGPSCTALQLLLHLRHGRCLQVANAAPENSPLASLITSPPCSPRSAVHMYLLQRTNTVEGVMGDW